MAWARHRGRPLRAERSPGLRLLNRNVALPIGKQSLRIPTADRTPSSLHLGFSTGIKATRPQALYPGNTGFVRTLVLQHKTYIFSFVSRVEEIAKRKNISMAQVSIAWMLSKEGVSAPIVGSTCLKNLEDIIGGYLIRSCSFSF